MSSRDSCDGLLRVTPLLICEYFNFTENNTKGNFYKINYIQFSKICLFINECYFWSLHHRIQKWVLYLQCVLC